MEILNFTNKLFSFNSVTTIALLSILLTLITPMNTMDTKESMQARFNYASKLKEISNNRVTYNYTPEAGVFCMANDFIKEQSHLYDIPKKMSLSPLYIFPFKFEIAKLLEKIPSW